MDTQVQGRPRAWTLTIVFIVLTASISLVTLYEVHQHQHHVHTVTRYAEDVTDLQRLGLGADGGAATGDEATDDLSGGASSQSSTTGDDFVLPAVSAQDCHIHPNTEFDGKVVRWGADHFQPTVGDCCNACHANPDCNVWVWCGDPKGCGNGRAYKECWLKQNSIRNIVDTETTSHPGIKWTSGAIYSQFERDRVFKVEKERLERLKNNTDLPLVYLDVSIKGTYIGRMKFVLFVKESPRAAENFRALCTGEKGIVPPGREGAGKPLHFKGALFYRIIDRFIDQTGANTESVFGGAFKDDEGGLKLRHDRKGLLSMANAGPDTNTSHFSILMAPAPHLDGHYTIFGELVEGWEVAEKINALARDKPNNTAGAEEQAVIVDSGQIR